MHLPQTFCKIFDQRVSGNKNYKDKTAPKSLTWEGARYYAGQISHDSGETRWWRPVTWTCPLGYIWSMEFVNCSNFVLIWKRDILRSWTPSTTSTKFKLSCIVRGHSWSRCFYNNARFFRVITTSAKSHLYLVYPSVLRDPHREPTPGAKGDCISVEA